MSEEISSTISNNANLLFITFYPVSVYIDSWDVFVMFITCPDCVIMSFLKLRYVQVFLQMNLMDRAFFNHYSDVEMETLVQILSLRIKTMFFLK
jgi:hypothetical protein